MNATPAKPQGILFVDDDPVFLETVGDLFRAWSGGSWEVHLAPTGAKALSLLQEHPVELVVIDIHMPVMDGVQFLALLNRTHPTLRKVVMTGFASDDCRAGCLADGAELFLEKPRTPEGYETVFATFKELASLRHQDGFRGVLRQVGLPDLIQMECLGRNSSVLEVSNGQLRGLIYIEQGAILHAELGRITGEPAFNQLLCLRGGEFNLKPYIPPSQRSIQGSWEFLLMEAARRRDELADLASPPPGDEGAATGPAMPTLHPPPPPAASAPSGSGTLRTDELIICSGQSEVLYEWQCPDLNSRLHLLDALGRKAEQVGRVFKLGRFDRLEVVGPAERVVAQIAPDKKVFVRCSRDAAAAEGLEAAA